MKYLFKCYTHEVFEIEAPIAEGPPAIVTCPVCYEESMRVYEALPIKYNTQGFHTTDYDKHGDKLERFNAQWEKKYNEKAPPPAKDVPKNATDIY